MDVPVPGPQADRAPRDRGRPARDEHTEPLEARHHNRATGLAAIVAGAQLGARTRQAAGLAGADGTQPSENGTLRFLKHTAIQDAERTLLRDAGSLGGDAGGALGEEPGVDGLGVPVRRVEQVGKAFGAGRSMLRVGEEGAEFREQEGVGAVAIRDDGGDGGGKRADQATVQLLIQLRQERVQEALTALREISG